MLFQSRVKHFGLMVLALAMIAGCGGGGDVDMNFTVGNPGTAAVSNWPWPWLSDADFFAKKQIFFNVNIAGYTHFRLDGVNGEIAVTALPGADSVSVTAEARVGSDALANAQAGLYLLDVSLSDSGGEIVVQTEQPAFPQGRQYIVDYAIIVPSTLPVSLSLENGYVTVSGAEGPVFIDMNNGDVKCEDLGGDVTVSIENGSFDGVVSLPINGEAVIATVNGDIDLSIPTSTSAQFFATVENGAISRNNLDMTNVLATSSSLQGVLGSGAGLVDLETVNGNISVSGI